MEQNQPLKKRITEESSFYPPQRTYLKSSTPQNQRQPQPGQYYQQQQDPGMDLHHRHQQPIQAVPQIIQYEYYEAPMTLNAWTQTHPDDFPYPPPSLDTTTEAELLARIQELEQNLRVQSDLINEIKKENARSSTPEQIPSKSIKTIPSEIKHEARTYRILTQSNEATNEAQIEIELTDEPETSNLNISSPKVYTLQTSPPPPINKKDIDLSPKTPEMTKGSMVSIGPNGTKIPSVDFEKISWTSASIATRKLLTIIFNRETLATHSMTGKASPAFKDLNKPVKGKLEPNAIQDIIYVVSKKCGVSAKEVRSAITTKCADENKMLKLKQLKRSGPTEPKRAVLAEINKRKKEDKENP